MQKNRSVFPFVVWLLTLVACSPLFTPAPASPSAVPAVTEVPPTATNLSVSRVTETSSHITWTIGEKGTLQKLYAGSDRAKVEVGSPDGIGLGRGCACQCHGFLM